MRAQDAVFIGRPDHPQTAHATVVFLCCGEPPSYLRSHEGVTFSNIAQRIALLKGCAFAGEYDHCDNNPGWVYWVPSKTIIGAEAANALGIFTDADLFGGVVPYAFVATKAIVHPVVAPEVCVPAGWSHEFAERVRDLVPVGFTAFTIADARAAARLLLERGPIRLKPVHEAGARGQVVVSNPAGFDDALRAMDAAEIREHGLVIEENFDDPTIYSIGSVRISDHMIAYYGTQRVTTDNFGCLVYGGSDLVVVRGDFDALLRFDLPQEAALAAERAVGFDRAASELFPHFYASRRNYDVICGTDSCGRHRCGVLEQSWRIGGASGAELAALEAFAAQPALAAVRASSIELFGDSEVPPSAAIVHFRGADDALGFMTKYTLVEPYDDAR